MSILAVPSPPQARQPLRSDTRLRVTTAGSVDDGKSTLIGRLLYDTEALAVDQRAALAATTQDGAVDLASLTDGLEDERAQGITIDVAYRYFATPRRSFVLADAPGHDQYTRNMVTAASQADVAIILIDASRVPAAGLLPQTRRHAAIASLMGLEVVVAVNKMDLASYDPGIFQDIRERMVRWAACIGLDRIEVLPIAARPGCNVTRASANLAWWRGPTLLELLETLPGRRYADTESTRLDIQRVIRGDRRAYAGRVLGADLVVGAPMRQAFSGAEATIASVATADGPLAGASQGANVVVTLDREIDLARGDVLVNAASTGVPTQRFIADAIWLSDAPLSLERRYRLKQGPRRTSARIVAVEALRDLETFEERPSPGLLRANDIGRLSILTRDPLVVKPFAGDPETAAFVLIDEATGQTAAAGLFRSPVE